ncbi:MAG: hypothetical protein ACI9Y1_002685, partial [Lentisphaeria bacterium]
VGAEGVSDVLVLSQGRMHEQGGALALQRISIYSDNIREYISILSEDGFAQLAGQYVTTIAQDTPPIDMAALENYGSTSGLVSNVNVNFSLFSQAHAQESSSFGWGLLNWILPIESFVIVFEQLGYLMGIGDGEFQADEFIIALVDVVTIFPPAKPLKLFVKPLRAMTRALRSVNPKFMRYFAVSLSRVLKKAKKGEFDTLWNLLPFMVVGAQMYNDEDSREGLKFLISSIDSADDVLSWVDFLALPTDGWEGAGEVPKVDPFAGATLAKVNSLPLSFMFEQAYAAPTGSIISRIGASAAGTLLKKLKGRLTKKGALDLPDGIKALTQYVKGGSLKAIRHKIHHFEVASVASALKGRLSAQGIKNLMSGKNKRHHPLLIVAALAVVEYENTCGRALDDPESPPTDPDPDYQSDSEILGCNGIGLTGKTNRAGVYRAIASASKAIAGAPNGGVYHILQLAKYQALYRAGSPLRVKNVEAERWVPFYKDEKAVDDARELLNFQSGVALRLLSQTKPAFKRHRVIDIVLANANNEEDWIELKSFAWKSAQKPKEPATNNFEKWKLTGATTAITKSKEHRQFVIDRAAKIVGASWNRIKEDSPNNIPDQAYQLRDFKWCFDTFTVKKANNTIKSKNVDLGGISVTNSIKWYLKKEPLAGTFKDTAKYLKELGSVATASAMNGAVSHCGPISEVKTALESGGSEILSELTTTDEIFEQLED